MTDSPTTRWIRDETAGDAESVRHVVAEAFGRPDEADLVAAIHAGGHAVIALVAVVGEPGGLETVAGSVLFSPVTTEPARPGLRGLGLAPLAVARHHQRRGIGAALVAEGLRRAAESGYDFAVVLGDPHYYARFGFTPASGFALGSVYDAGDAFMAQELRPGALAPSVGGDTLIRYGPEFDI